MAPASGGAMHGLKTRDEIVPIINTLRYLPPSTRRIEVAMKFSIKCGNLSAYKSNMESAKRIKITPRTPMSIGL